MKKQIVVKTGKSVIDLWLSSISDMLIEFEVIPHTSPLIRNEDVSYVVAWRPDALWVNGFKNLKALVSIGSGVDHVKNLPQLRTGIPVLRTVSPDLAQKMSEFVVMCTLVWHRKLISMLEANDDKRWEVFDVPLASKLTVGIMGYGRMGKAVAGALSSLGYRIKVWSRQSHDDVQYTYFFGRENLDSFTNGCDVLVCLLPLTEETSGILDYKLIKCMNKGGCLINTARGGHLVEKDLIKAMEGQLLSYAFLDVLSSEPLPPDSPLWDTKNVVITYHSAAYISAEVGSQIIADNIRAFEYGRYEGPFYNPALGY